MKVKFNIELALTFCVDVDVDAEFDTAQVIQLLMLLATVASLFI